MVLAVVRDAVASHDAGRELIGPAWSCRALRDDPVGGLPAGLRAGARPRRDYPDTWSTPRPRHERGDAGDPPVRRGLPPAAASAGRPVLQGRVGHLSQVLAGGAAGGLHGDAVRHGHEIARKQRGVGVSGQVTFVDGLLEPFAET